MKIKLSTQTRAKDKDKPLFCGKDFYIDHQSEFKTLELFTRNLCPKNRLIIYTVSLCCLRRKTDWYSGKAQFPRKIINSESSFLDNSTQLFQLFKDLNIRWPQSLSTMTTLFDFLSEVQIKPLPIAAQNGIFHFYVGDYDLQILADEPTPQEILKLQIQNQRVLTFETDYKVWPEKIYGHRDILSFLLHDFIHAEHFFSDPHKRSGQIGFYKFVDQILNCKRLDQCFLSTEFNAQFSYLISDMNSHVIHLLKTLRAIIDGAHFDPNLWSQICELVAPIAQPQIHRINTPLFSTKDAIRLTSYFEAL